MLCENNWKHIVQKVENWQTSHLHVFVHRIQFCFFRTVLFNCILRFEEPTPPSTAIYPYEGNTEEVDFSKQHENNKQKHNQNRFTKKKGLTGRITKKQNTKPGLSCFFFVVWFSSFFFSRFALVLCFVCNTLHSLCCWTHKSTYFRSGCHTSRLEDPSRAFIRHCLWECFIFIRWFIIPMNYIYTHNI